MRFNRQTFFTRYRQEFGKLQQKQVDGLNFLLDKIEADTFTLEQAAYVLATVAHETDHTFQPIKEKRARVGTKVRALQDKYWDSGFYGRGYVQLTWKANYEKYGIADNPDAALQPEKAYEILSTGMRKGAFTGKKLTDYIIAGDVDYVQARRIVNGLDRASDIAEIAEKFEDILRAAGKESSESPVVEPEKKPEPPAIPDTPDVVVTAEQPKPTDPKEKAEVSGHKSWTAAVTTFFTGIGGGVLSWAQGASTTIVVGFFGSAGAVAITYVIMRYWYRNKENERLKQIQLEREHMAHELTVLKIKSAMDRNSNTVGIAQ